MTIKRLLTATTIAFSLATAAHGWSPPTVTASGELRGEPVELRLIASNSERLDLLVVRPNGSELLRASFTYADLNASSLAVPSRLLAKLDHCRQASEGRQPTLSIEDNVFVLSAKMKTPPYVNCDGERDWSLEIRFEMPEDYREQLGIIEDTACDVVLAHNITDKRQVVGATFIAYPYSTHMHPGWPDDTTRFDYLTIPGYSSSGPKTFDPDGSKFPIGEQFEVISVRDGLAEARRLLDGSVVHVPEQNLMQGNLADCDIRTVFREDLVDWVFVEFREGARPSDNHGRWRDLSGEYGFCYDITAGDNSRVECSVLNEDGKFEQGYNFLPSELEYTLTKPGAETL